MRVLITWGSKRGGTREIAQWLAAALQQQGHDVALLAPRQALKASPFDAAIVGGALYANRWPRDVRRFVARSEQQLRAVPVWFFSSGPLDRSAEQQDIAPTPEVQRLMERVGALGHVTFGGRLAPDARGFPASAMAKKHAGDWRNAERVRAWALQVARALPAARPGRAVVQPGHSPWRLVLHGITGWALCALTMLALLRTGHSTAALVMHAFAAPLIFALISQHYFRARGARDALATAVGFAAIVALLDAVVVAGLIQRSLALFGSVAGFWLPLALIFAVSWATGELLAMLPPHAGRSAAR